MIEKYLDDLIKESMLLNQLNNLNEENNDKQRLIEETTYKINQIKELIFSYYDKNVYY